MMSSVEGSAFLLAACLVSALAGVASWLWPRVVWAGRMADGSGWLALFAASLVWALRWSEADHLPLFGTYESALSLALAVLLAAGAFRLKGATPPSTWPVACLVAGVIVVHGLRYDTTAYALTISERSWVVDVHAVLAWAAFAVLTSQLGFAVYRLARRRKDALLDRRVAFTLSLAFFLHTAMLASGSLYKFLLFGSAWSFDPVETLGLVAWMAYGTLLHLHLLAGWEGRRLAAWSIGLFAILLVSYRGIVYFPAWSTYHIFDVDLRIHLIEEVDGAQRGEP